MKITMPPAGISGRYRMVVSSDQECKEVKHDTGEFKNLITNVGMNRIGVVNTSQVIGINSFNVLCGRFVVGGGSTAPSFTDTALDSPIAYAAANSALHTESSSYALGYYEITVKYQFGMGVAAGNLSEIGIQMTNSSGPLWSRALILDGDGNPTTITVLSTDFLTCYYTLRVMIPLTDAVFNIDVDYEGSPVATVVTARPLQADNSNATDGWGLQTFDNGGPLVFYSGGLASATASTPLGTSQGSVSSPSAVSYVSDSYQRYVRYTAGISSINSSSLATARVLSMMGKWQVNFNPPLAKNNTQTMVLDFGYSWARA